MPGGHTPFGTRVFQSQAPPAINPLSLTNLELYLDPSSVVDGGTDGSNVTRWKDISGNPPGRDLAQIPAGLINPIGRHGFLLGGGVLVQAGPNGGSASGISNTIFPSTNNSNGYTQYILSGVLTSAANITNFVYFNNGASISRLVSQAAGFNEGLPNIPTGHCGILDGLGNIDLGVSRGDAVITVSDFYTIAIVQGTGGTKVYNGLGGVIGTNTGATFVAQVEVDCAGVSLGGFYQGVNAAYLLFSQQHSAKTVVGVMKYLCNKWGIKRQ